MNLEIVQKFVTLPPFRRGFHIVTSLIQDQVPELSHFNQGLAHIHILHTSASLTLNENADPDVRRDMESIFNHLIPENEPYYLHTLEGSDDMPAHVKSSVLGSSVTVPVGQGRFLLGTWQGIYLGEHRNQGGPRRLVVTVLGQKFI